MHNRIGYLLKASGWNGFLRTLLMLATAVGLAITEFVLFREFYCGSVAVALTALGWMFRKSIMEFGVNYSSYSKPFLFMYGLVLVLANRAGLGVQVELAIISFACTFLFNLNFWTITEAAIADQQLS